MHPKRIIMSGSGFSALRRYFEREVLRLQDELNRKNVWDAPLWNASSSLDDYTRRGCFLINGRHTASGDGLPAASPDEPYDFSALLMVSGLDAGDDLPSESIAGQMLVLSNLQSGSTDIFVRSWLYGEGVGEWGKWSRFAYDSDIAAVQNTIQNSIQTTLDRLSDAVFPLLLSFSVSPSTTQELTGAAKEFKLSWGCTVDGEAVTPDSVSLTVDGKDVPVADASAVSHTFTAADDFTAAITVASGSRTASKSLSVNFARRYYAGIVDADWAATASAVKALGNTGLKTARTVTLPLAAFTQRRVVFAYPVAHGRLTAIADAYGSLLGNGNIFPGDPLTVSIVTDSATNTACDYYVYLSDVYNLPGASSYTFTSLTVD